MILFNDKKTQLDDLLDKMAENIQLGKTRYDRMIEHYEAVKNWIESDEKFFNPFKYDIYPHGSVRIQTTVKPLEKDEFDLDIVIQLKTDWNVHSPQRIYKELKRRLGEHEVYKAKMESKNRCLRLNYAGDFHMDIMPGVQEFSYDEDRIMVPDKEMNRWVSSNPRGYSKWFHNKANMVKQSLLEKALRAEGLPADNFENKKPLQRAVQLIKRYRDVYFQEDDAFKTSSIVLTTIVGQFYSGEDSIYETIDNVIAKILNNMRLQSGRIKVFNPVNPDEDFTDKWGDEHQYHIEFEKFSKFLHEEWQKLKQENGVLAEGVLLKGLFGAELFTKAQKAQNDQLEEMRREGKLYINRDTGGVTSLSGVSSQPVKKNTFFGL